MEVLINVQDDSRYNKTINNDNKKSCCRECLITNGEVKCKASNCVNRIKQCLRCNITI